MGCSRRDPLSSPAPAAGCEASCMSLPDILLHIQRPETGMLTSTLCLEKPPRAIIPLRLSPPTLCPRDIAGRAISCCSHHGKHGGPSKGLTQNYHVIQQFSVGYTYKIIESRDAKTCARIQLSGRNDAETLLWTIVTNGCVHVQRNRKCRLMLKQEPS